jgi:hypothetical protein
VGNDALKNSDTQTVLVREENRTTITLAFNYRGDLSDFTVVFPVPVVLGADDVRVIDPELLERLGTFTAPRAVRYPCSGRSRGGRGSGGGPIGVTPVQIEDEFVTGAYQITILSANESSALFNWLNAQGYQLPPGAIPILQSYIDQGMFFLAARVTLDALARDDFAFLSPLQMSFESDMFGLPIRMGTINAADQQDLLIYTIVHDLEVQVDNYTNVRLDRTARYRPDDWDSFDDFVDAQFEATRTAAGPEPVVVTEYVGPTFKGDPPTTDPITPEELLELGYHGSTPPHVTRLHMRYAPDEIDADLAFFLKPPRFFTPNFVEVRTPLEIVCPPDLTLGPDESTDPSHTGTATLVDYDGPDPNLRYADQRITSGTCGEITTIRRFWWSPIICANQCEQTITIVDPVEPTLADIPDDATIECGDVPRPAEVTATDIYDGNPVIAMSEVRENGVCPDSYTLVRTWTATNSCGYSTEASQTIIVQDTTQPAVSCPDDLSVSDNGGVVLDFDVTAMDNCDPIPVVSTDVPSGSVFDTGVTTVTATAADACGNTSTCAFDVIVSCFAIQEFQIKDQEPHRDGKPRGKVKIRATFAPGAALDPSTEDVRVTVIDVADGDALEFQIPAGSFALRGKPEKPEYAYHTPNGVTPEIRAAIKLDQCAVEFQADRVDTSPMDGHDLTVYIEAGVNVGEETVTAVAKTDKLKFKADSKPWCYPHDDDEDAD